MMITHFDKSSAVRNTIRLGNSEFTQSPIEDILKYLKSTWLACPSNLTTLLSPGYNASPLLLLVNRCPVHPLLKEYTQLVIVKQVTSKTVVTIVIFTGAHLNSIIIIMKH